MKALILAGGGIRDKALGEAFVRNSVSTAFVTGEQAAECLKSSGADLVFSLEFNRALALSCKEHGIRYACLSAASVAPMFFHPAVLSGEVWAFSTEAFLIRKLKKLGAGNAYYEAVSLPEERDPWIRGNAIFDRTWSFLDAPTRRYLEGLMDAAAVSPRADVIYKGISPEALDMLEIASDFGSVSGQDMKASRRYYLSDCLLKCQVIVREQKKIEELCASLQPEESFAVRRFDVTGTSSLFAMESGKLLFSDGAGLPEGFIPGEDYVRYEDGEELARLWHELKGESGRAAEIASSGRQKAGKYSPEVFVRRLLDKMSG
ncbi:MAG: glycosyltransferase [Lachnospiraceae bacterium]|nr:glycosyltransferase [Lachnospiraceae bacterium]